MVAFSLWLLPEHQLGGLRVLEEALRKLLASLESWRVGVQVSEILLKGVDNACWDKEASRDELLNETSRGEFDFIMAAPAASTFSKHSGAAIGYPAVRSREFPYGLHGLAEAAKTRLVESNGIHQFVIKLLRAAAQAGSFFGESRSRNFLKNHSNKRSREASGASPRKTIWMLIHPGDMGGPAREGQDVHSPWCWREAIELRVSRGAMTFAWRRCSLDPAENFAKPMRAITNLPGAAHLGLEGWIRLGPSHRYLDHLPLSRGHSRPKLRSTVELKRRSLVGAKWPQELVRLVVSDSAGRRPPSKSSLLDQLASSDTPTRKLAKVLPVKEDPVTSDEDEDGFPRPRFGEGWVVRGRPIQVIGEKHGSREIHTGGGLRLPGRLPPSRRSLPRMKGLGRLRSQWYSFVREMDVSEDGEEGQCRKIVYLLASQKLSESPFSEDTIKTVEGQMNRMLKEEKDENGVTSWIRPEATDRKQPVAIRPLQSSLRFCEKPDWWGLHKYAKGVKLGWDVKLPRTPAMFGLKDSLGIGSVRSGSESGQVLRWEPNHKSPMDDAEICLDHFESEIAKDRTARVLLQEALQGWKGRLMISAMGWAPGDRITHDATYGVEVNHRIEVRD